MTEKTMTNEESLRIISEMIGQAKRNYSKGGSYYFLLWGWVVLIANLGHYILDKTNAYEYPYAIWVITLPAIVLTIVHGTKNASQARVVTHIDRMYGEVWIGAAVGIVLSLAFMHQIGLNHAAVILMFAGMATFISGRLMKFSPLVLGGVALWIGSAVCFFVPLAEQTLVSAIAIAAGYLVPGYILKNKAGE